MDLKRRSTCLKITLAIKEERSNAELESIYVDLLAFADTDAKMEAIQLVPPGRGRNMEKFLAEAQKYADLLEPPRRVSKPTGGGVEAPSRRPSTGRGRGRGRGPKEK